MFDLTLRNLQPEIMDDPLLDPREHEQALQGLVRIHRLTNVAAKLWKKIKSNVVLEETNTLSIIDVGCGDGFLLRQFHGFANKAGVKTRLTGFDFSANAISIAQDAAKQDNLPIEFHELDVTQAAKLPLHADVVFCSLFLHHFREQEVIQILKTMNSASKQIVLVHDLRRTRLGYLLCWIGVHLLSSSHVVRTDGLLSVRAAFTVAEFKGLVEAAGITQAQVAKSWPERFTVTWSKSEPAQ